jgi:Tol biopolymer transport system component
MKSIFGGPVRGHIQVELLSAYLDQQASPAERAYVDAHLQQCTACRTELESLRQTVAVLHLLPRVALPRAFTLSEVQVGMRRPAAAPSWFGGLARGLGAVTAVAVVAFIAVTVLRPEQTPWNPSQTVARVQPTTVVATEARLAPAPMAPAAAEAPQAKAQERAPAAVTEPSPEPALAMMATPEPEKPAALEAAPAGAMGSAESAADLAGAAASAPEIVADAAAAPMLAAKAAPTEAVSTMSAAAMGRGGGGPEEPAGIAPELLTPEPAPIAQPLATALPSDIRFAYADLNALWAVDRDGGTRQLVQARGINTPQLSPDQTWIAYRISNDAGLQVWAVRWGGGEPKLLIDDTKLPAEQLPTGYVRRAIRDTRWTPQGNILSITLTLVPDPQQPELPLKTELWQMDVETGTLRFVSELGPANRPYDSPDGSQYLLVQYGTDASPEGSVSVYDAASGKGRTVLTFTASPGKNSYESQVSWTPDGKSAWVAIPEADYGLPTPPNGTTLYKVGGAGELIETSQVDAFQVYWSPAGGRMAYTRFISESLATNELYLADEDGANPQLYATMTQGEFISWSPQGDRFLYQDNFQVFVGEPGKAPQRLTNSVSMVGPRWVSDTQVMALHDTGEGWLLTLRDVTGDAVALLPLPREAMWDVGR